MKVVVFGANGWIGGYTCPILATSGFEVIPSPKDLRADDTENVLKFLKKIRPTHVLSLIGRTHGDGYSTIDYLEQKGKLVENIRDNLFAPVSLALFCEKHGIHFTYLGTGCIFDQDDPTLCKYSENDLPDFYGSSYSVVKGFTDRLFHMMPKALNVRIRMPITAETSPRNFITKITSYSRICSIPNSMTVLPILLPVMVDMMKKREIGTINLVNPGVITHNEILQMYKDIVDNSFTWLNFTKEEQNECLLSKRSNNQLCTEKLRSMYPSIPDIKTAVRMCIENIAKSNQM